MLFRPQGALLLSNLGVEVPEDDVTPKDTHTKTHTYRVARSRLTHFKFKYCAGAIACRGWREGER